MLLTRAPLYSPPCGDFRARLACVRHAASVDSEPGSNSQVKMNIPDGAGETPTTAPERTCESWPPWPKTRNRRSYLAYSIQLSNRATCAARGRPPEWRGLDTRPRPKPVASGPWGPCRRSVARLAPAGTVRPRNLPSIPDSMPPEQALQRTGYPFSKLFDKPWRRLQGDRHPGRERRRAASTPKPTPRGRPSRRNFVACARSGAALRARSLQQHQPDKIPQPL